jgi:hypothetical protein
MVSNVNWEITENNSFIYNQLASGLFGGTEGIDCAPGLVISKINISTLGNATEFGALAPSLSQHAACSSSTRALFGGGFSCYVGDFDGIMYVDYSTGGETPLFGCLTTERDWLSGCSSSTVGIFGGGAIGISSSVIDQVVFSTTGDATYFGNLTQARYLLASCASPTRGLFIGGGYTNIIDYITIASSGNAIDFGDIGIGKTDSLAACSSNITGVFAGGQGTSPGQADPRASSISYVTIPTTGNSSNFGTLSVSRFDLAACSSNVRGIFAGGLHFINESSAASINSIEYITIATTGNASDFGDLTQNSCAFAGCSDCHGGLS